MTNDKHPMHLTGTWLNGVFHPKKGEASHVTENTRKYQCNAPLAWEKQLRALAKEVGGPDAELAVGIRAALAKGLGIKMSAEELARGGRPAKVAKPVKAKVAKAKKAKVAKAKKAKAPKVAAEPKAPAAEVVS